MSNSATIKQIDITGASDPDKLLKVDISTHAGGGSVGFQDTNTAPTKALDDSVTIQGIKGVVNKIGTMASRSAVGSIVGADLGNVNSKKALTVIKPVDDATFKPHLISDIISSISTVAVELKGYDLMLEEYSFTGLTIDGLNDLAGLLYGSVNYISTDDKYAIVGGDYTGKLSSNSSSGLKVTDDILISWEETTEKSTALMSFGSALIAAAKELARLRAAILDIPVQASVSTSEVKELNDIVAFDFGFKTGPKQIPDYMMIDSVNWDEWYFDALGIKYASATGDAIFVSKQTIYYFTEVTKECSVNVSSGGQTQTVARGKMRGLRSLRLGTTLLFRVKNCNVGSTIYGRGYLTNLVSLGLPSVTKFKADALASAGSQTPFDDCYHQLFDVQIKKVKIKISETSTLTADDYVPYLAMTMSPALANDAFTALKAKNTAAGNSAAPTDFEIDDLLLSHQYGAKVEVMSSTVITNLKYKGWVDKYGRLISDSGQVQLILTAGTSTTSGQGAGQVAFFGPIEGMDMSFITTNIAPATPSAGATTSSLLNDYFDETAITSNLVSAYNDLKLLCGAQAPIGQYDAASTTYPRFIYEILPQAVGTPPSTKGALIGVVFGIKEPTAPTLSLTGYVSSDKAKKQLERKVKCLESKIALIVKCIKKNDPQSSVTSQIVKDLLKKIIKYNTLLARVKNESLTTMMTMKLEYETALNDCITKFNGTSNAKVHKVSVSVLIPDTLPNIGDTLTMPGTITSNSYKVTSVNVSGVTANITGEVYV